MLDHSEFDQHLAAISEFAESGYYLAFHIRFVVPIWSKCTYHEEWLRRYTEDGYVFRDPVIGWAFAVTGSTRWSDPEIPDPFHVFEESRRFGLKYGMTVSHGPTNSRSLGSLARSDREFTDAEMTDVQRLVIRMHELTQPDINLTESQIEALRCLAEGDRHAAAANRLGISESALKQRLSAARERLMARTTAEAIQKAKAYELI